MFDAALRPRLAPVWAGIARPLHRAGVRAVHLTGAGFVLGLVAAGCAAASWWQVALVVWLVSRLFDGLDGTVARLEGPTVRGGFLDLMADFAVYAAFVAGVAYAVPDARLAAVVLLCTFYLSGAAFLAWSALVADAHAERASDGLALGDDRTVRFVGGLAEGFETIVAYCIVCIVPAHADVVLWVFAGFVAITALQRVVFAGRDLGRFDAP